ncbi:GntR family transcriptional regulator [Nonomuraea mesophila]|uniref:GntR family transcriptional regulator n=1 Tax=Nonomuraea mesophila TaxID=2530382 RepID=A0A4R5FTL1_9ACTN|nr:GntR family transcriptional regulator [Nonomuraea mesophila]TDE56416.1 GntR family transcriptional regulator [Nonomuraea mesophila]
MEPLPVTASRAPVPKRAIYERIADDLRDAIRNNALRDESNQPTDRLPGEVALAEQYGVSLGTAQNALNLLKHEGLIDRTPKRGSRVIKVRKKFLRDGIKRLEGDPGHRFMLADIDTRELRVRHFTAGTCTAQVHEEEMVKCFGSHMRLLYRRRVYEVVGPEPSDPPRPVSLATNYMPLYLFADGGEAVQRQDSGPGGIWARLAEAGHEVTDADEYVDCRMPTPEEARELGIGVHTPVFVVYRVAENDRGQVVDLAVIVLPGDRWRMRYKVRKQPSPS